MGSSVFDVASFIVDPLNVTGIQDYGSSGSTGSRVSAPPVHTPAAPAVAQAPQPTAKGFMASIGPSRAGRFGDINRQMPATPGPQWGYTPGQGVTWNTSHRVGSSTNFAETPNAVGSEGFSAFRGNRI